MLDPWPSFRRILLKITNRFNLFQFYHMICMVIKVGLLVLCWYQIIAKYFCEWSFMRWWWHNMVTLSPLLVLFDGYPLVTNRRLHEPVMKYWDIFLLLVGTSCWIWTVRFLVICETITFMLHHYNVLLSQGEQGVDATTSDFSTVSLHSLNGRQMGCARGLSAVSEKWWKFQLVMWAQHSIVTEAILTYILTSQSQKSDASQMEAMFHTIQTTLVPTV